MGGETVLYQEEVWEVWRKNLRMRDILGLWPSLQFLFQQTDKKPILASRDEKQSEDWTDILTVYNLW